MLWCLYQVGEGSVFRDSFNRDLFEYLAKTGGKKQVEKQHQTGR
jgi:hypothetical protein